MVLKIDYVKLGKFLKTKRENAGLSQRTVAEKLGYTTPQFVSNWERGVINPPLLTLALLIKMYKFPRHELVDFLKDESAMAIEKAF